MHKARKFSNTFRFIDDLSAINDVGLFELNYAAIYPEEMKLDNENDGYTAASFLDLDISIVDYKFLTKLFDKRDSFHLVLKGCFLFLQICHQKYSIPH